MVHGISRNLIKTYKTAAMSTVHYSAFDYRYQQLMPKERVKEQGNGSNISSTEKGLPKPCLCLYLCSDSTSGSFCQEFMK